MMPSSSAPFFGVRRAIQKPTSVDELLQVTDEEFAAAPL
jgi:hypothetical protein